MGITNWLINRVEAHRKKRAARIEKFNQNVEALISGLNIAIKASEENMKFKVGDKVKAFGRVGEVVSTYPEHEHNFGTIEVRFEPGLYQSKTFKVFLDDGRFEDWHKEPSLELIERPKQKITKWLWANPDTGAMSMHYRKIAHHMYTQKLEWSATEFEV